MHCSTCHYQLTDFALRILFHFFPHGKIIFQSYLREAGYNLSEPSLSGASAGALSATLAKLNVCPLQATELALSLSDDVNVWERPLGLQGVWGNMIYEWLDQLLPEDAEEMVTKGGEVGCDVFVVLLGYIHGSTKQQTSSLL